MMDKLKHINIENTISNMEKQYSLNRSSDIINNIYLVINTKLFTKIECCKIVDYIKLSLGNNVINKITGKQLHLNMLLNNSNNDFEYNLYNLPYNTEQNNSIRSHQMNSNTNKYIYHRYLFKLPFNKIELYKLKYQECTLNIKFNDNDVFTYHYNKYINNIFIILEDFVICDISNIIINYIKEKNNKITFNLLSENEDIEQDIPSNQEYLDILSAKQNIKQFQNIKIIIPKDIIYYIMYLEPSLFNSSNKIYDFNMSHRLTKIMFIFKCDVPKVNDPKVNDPKVNDPKVNDPKVNDLKVDKQNNFLKILNEFKLNIYDQYIKVKPIINKNNIYIINIKHINTTFVNINNKRINVINKYISPCEIKLSILKQKHDIVVNVFLEYDNKIIYKYLCAKLLYE
jgi:hypothetical protein